MLLKIWLIFLIFTRVHGGNRIQPRFAGGHEVAIEDCPFIVMIQQDGYWICAGTIITFKWILTTASCVYKDWKNPKPYSIISGGTIYLADTEITENELTQRRNVKKIIIHPDYKTYGQSQSDIALLHLTEELKETNGTRKVHLYEGSIDTDTSYVDVYKTLINGTCIGFDWTKMLTENNTLFDTLLAAPFYLIDFKTCEQYYEGLYEDEHICAFTRDHYACKGLPTGSLFCIENVNQQLIQVGIPTMLNGCAHEHPEIFLSTVYYRNYIKEAMKNGFPKFKNRLFYLMVVVFIINR